MKTITHLFLAMFIFAIWVGCSRSQGPVAEEKSNSPSVSEPAAPATDPAPLQVRVGDETDLAALLEKNRGKVVLVDFWATWCPPCMELLPHTLEMAKKYADRGLVVILVAINDPTDQARVKSVLETNQAAGVTNLICRYGVGLEAVEKFAIDGGALPHLRLYDRQGQVHMKFGATDVAPNPARIEEAVVQLLETPEAPADQPTAGPELIVPEI
ncbi:MAG: redoxin family protein [Thermogutta sp.]